MTDDFVPEADAMEQDQEVNGDVDTAEVPEASTETPEADALEQAQVVPDNDDAP